jgi:hypothetical protein
MLFSLVNCSKEQITYPNTGNYGINLLNEDSTEFVSSGYLESWGPNFDREIYYSLNSELPEGTSLVITISRTTDYGLWYYQNGSGLNLIVQDYDFSSNTQNFSAYGQSVTDLKMVFVDSGSAKIEIFENGATEATHVKNISWKR